MSKIREFMAGDHRRCDDIFAEVEVLVAEQDWVKAIAGFDVFQHAVLQHFSVEESLLFPAFEEQTGMRMGPTQVMRGEHAQMRELLEAARIALVAKDADDYSGNAETLLIMMQQHNMKEENVLYPMCDQHLSGQIDALLPKLETQIQATAE
jgi:hemerythrin-like domain-containing protein